MTPLVRFALNLAAFIFIAGVGLFVFAVAFGFFSAMFTSS